MDSNGNSAIKVNTFIIIYYYHYYYNYNYYCKKIQEGWNTSNIASSANFYWNYRNIGKLKYSEPALRPPNWVFLGVLKLPLVHFCFVVCITECLLQRNYCSHGHLYKFNQSDNIKITIHNKKVGCQSQLLQRNINNRDQNQPVRQPTDVTFWTRQRKPTWFLRGLLEYWLRGDKHNIAYIFYLT